MDYTAAKVRSYLLNPDDHSIRLTELEVMLVITKMLLLRQNNRNKLKVSLSVFVLLYWQKQNNFEM